MGPLISNNIIEFTRTGISSHAFVAGHSYACTEDLGVPDDNTGGARKIKAGTPLIAVGARYAPDGVNEIDYLICVYHEVGQPPKQLLTNPRNMICVR